MIRGWKVVQDKLASFFGLGKRASSMRDAIGLSGERGAGEGGEGRGRRARSSRGS